MTAATYPAAMIRSVHRAVSRAAARRLRRLDLGVVNVRQHLAEVAHVEQRPADRAFFEMIGRGSISQPTGLKADRPGA
jgi:hypothetical protein